MQLLETDTSNLENFNEESDEDNDGWNEDDLVDQNFAKKQNELDKDTEKEEDGHAEGGDRTDNEFEAEKNREETDNHKGKSKVTNNSEMILEEKMNRILMMKMMIYH